MQKKMNAKKKNSNCKNACKTKSKILFQKIMQKKYAKKGRGGVYFINSLLPKMLNKNWNLFTKNAFNYFKTFLGNLGLLHIILEILEKAKIRAG